MPLSLAAFWRISESLFILFLEKLNYGFLVLTAPLMKPFVPAYVDENGLAYTDHASKSRINHKTTLHPDRANAKSPGSRTVCSPAKDRIMKSIKISVDREDVELLKRR
ncbi:hypothetical protein N7471_009017 [Penicillium samsonianum]|uniref:uncharacterized protein n=1 Tax=Penicillium samsonianum TaxID=1882272 RepID=UPI002548F197|nr:uncharacterized protein N7471_009017 [Penicillium samsonianum]KAJ6127800.1 hypothetical protein N7471_009017 [Penicillium samsonianum]